MSNEPSKPPTRKKLFDAPTLGPSDKRVRAPDGSPLRRVDDKVSALVRLAYMAPRDLPYPQRLMVHRFKVSSPAGEDGILSVLVREAGITRGAFLELGLPADGMLTGYLARELRWSGAVVESDTRRLKRVQPALEGSAVTWHVEPKDDRNLSPLISGSGLGPDVDVLAVSSDLQSAETWGSVSVDAKIVCLSYDASRGFDASLRPAVELATSRSCRLVAVEPEGGTAFFLADQVAPWIPAFDVEMAYAISRGRRRAPSAHKVG